MVKFDFIEKEILEKILDEVEDTVYGCGASCFEDVLESIEDTEEFKKELEEKVRESFQEEKELDPDAEELTLDEYIAQFDEDHIESVKEEVKYDLLNDKIKAVLKKLNRMIKE